MDHAIGGASGATLEQQPQRPGWWWTIGCLLLATLLSIVLVALVMWPLTALHVVPSDLDRPGAWPWPRTSVWATAAGLGPLLLTGFAFALAMRVVVSAFGDWHVRLWPIALLFALAAKSPAAHEDSTGLGLLLVIVVRQWSITREPLPRPPRPAWLAIGATGLLLALVTVSYQPLHPLSVVSTSDPSVYDGKVRSLPFTLFVDGAAGARILSVNVPDEYRSPVHYVVQLDDRHALERRQPQGAYVNGAIELSPGFCRRGYASVRPERLRVRLRALGRERTQELALDASDNITCPRHR